MHSENSGELFHLQMWLDEIADAAAEWFARICREGAGS